MKIKQITTAVLLVAALSVSCHLHNRIQEPAQLTFLNIDGQKIQDPSGNPVILKGCNLGNWLQLEMWMLGSNQTRYGDQFRFENTIRDRFGEAERHRLMEIFRENWITERDFELIRSFGMNTVRLPFEYRLLMDIERPFELREDAWYWLDKTVQLAEKYGLYVILDLHGAPGRQSGMDHTGRSGYNKLWTDVESQDQTAWLWQEISRHYKDNPVVAAYDILNEPWGGSEQELKAMILRCYEVIRSQGDEHIVIYPGHYSGIDFYEDVNGAPYYNVLYTAHFYPGFFGWGSPVPQVHADFLDNGLVEWKERMDRFNAPLLVGEFNVVSKRAGGGEMMRRYYDRYAQNGWAATMWSYKVLSQEGGMTESNWGMVTNAKPLAELDLESQDMNTIENWFKSHGSMKYAVDKDLRHWLTTAKQPSPLDDLPPLPPPITLAPESDSLPEGWTATDIGGPLSGGQQINGDEWTVYGGGADIWNDNDQFRYVWMPAEGDFDATVTVNALVNTNTYAKAGIMYRESLSPDSPHVLINVFPFGNTEFGYRESKAGLMIAKSGPAVELPGANLRLTRSGDQFSAMIKKDRKWVSAGEITLNQSSMGLLGLAILSHDNNQLTKAVFEDLKITFVK